MVKTNVFDEIIEFLAALNPKRVLKFHPSEKTQLEIEKLLEKKRQNILSSHEQTELEYYLMLEHIVRMAKAKALQKLSS